MGSDVTMTGTEIAVIEGGEEYKYAVKKQAIPRIFDNVSHILTAVQEKKVLSFHRAEG